MTNAFLLDRDLLLAPCEQGGLRYERLEEGLVGGKLTLGSAYMDYDGDSVVVVLVVDPMLTQTRLLEASEVLEWRQRLSGLSVWGETTAYRVEYAPGPWLSPVEDSGELAVASGL